MKTRNSMNIKLSIISTAILIATSAKGEVSLEKKLMEIKAFNQTLKDVGLPSVYALDTRRDLKKKGLNKCLDFAEKNMDKVGDNFWSTFIDSSKMPNAVYSIYDTTLTTLHGIRNNTTKVSHIFIETENECTMHKHRSIIWDGSCKSFLKLAKIDLEKQEIEGQNFSRYRAKINGEYSQFAMYHREINVENNFLCFVETQDAMTTPL